MTDDGEAAVPDLLAEARAWLAANWSADVTVAQWWARAYEAGWLFPSWPRGLGGRGCTADESRAVHEVFAAEQVLGPPFGVAQTHAVPTVLEHGNDEQRARLVPPVGRGLESWCQLFSEPDAGSDLAGLRTRAVHTDRGWVVNGQKVWTSGARQASRAILLARTDTSVPKHKGLSMFVLDLEQPGVDIRPLKQMNATASFNEVFLTDVHVDDRDLIGSPGDGWAAAMTTLAFERSVMNARVPGLVCAPPSPAYGALDRPAGAVVLAGEQAVPYIKDRAWISARALAGLARRHAVTDPAVLDELSAMYVLERAADWFDSRARQAERAGSGIAGSANVTKLVKSDLGRAAARLATEILDLDVLTGSDSDGEVAELTKLILSVPSFSISGGTDQVQLNIIAERGLGLPREVDPTRGLPFGQNGRSPAADGGS